MKRKIVVTATYELEDGWWNLTSKDTVKDIVKDFCEDHFSADEGFQELTVEVIDE